MSLENILQGLSSEEAQEKLIAVAVKKGLTEEDNYVKIAKKRLNWRDPENVRLLAQIALRKESYKEAIEGFSEIGMYREAADIAVQQLKDIPKAIDLLTKEARYQYGRWDQDGWERARKSLYDAINLTRQHNLDLEQRVYENFARQLIKTMGLTKKLDFDDRAGDSGFRFIEKLDNEEIKGNLIKKIIEIDSKEETKGYIAGLMCEFIGDRKGTITHYLNFFKEVKQDTSYRFYDYHNTALKAKERAEEFMKDLPKPEKNKLLKNLILSRKGKEAVSNTTYLEMIRELPEPEKTRFLEELIPYWEEEEKLFNAAYICEELGRYEQAIEYHKKGDEKEGIDPACDLMIARIYEKIGEQEEAKKIYENVAKSKLKVEVYTKINAEKAASLAEKAGNIDLAIKAYLKAYNYREALKLCLEHGKKVRARRIYNKAIQFYESALNFNAAVKLAKIMNDQKKIKLYQTIFQELGKVDPNPY